MTKFGDLEALRRVYVKSLYGRRFAMDQNDFLVGPRGLKTPISGLTSGSATIASTSENLSIPNYGVSLIGSQDSSGTTLTTDSATGSHLDAPEPGVSKRLLNITTAVITVGTINASAFFLSTGSAGSTYQYVTLWGKGASVDLFGITTAMWGVLGNVMTTVSTNVSFI